MKGKLIDNSPKLETAILAGVIKSGARPETELDSLNELEQLSKTAGAKAIARFYQRLPYPDPRTYFGSGKLAEVAAFAKENEVSMIIFDDDLSPSQLRNIEKQFTCKVLDRSNLILDIFATRAQTAQAKTQVELAQFQYLLPRLTRMWTHLSKHAGGIGTRGPGESEIETDRRAIRNRLSLLRDRLKLLEKQAETRRKNREGIFRVALVGYTNAGKSTLMNALSKAGVLQEDKLFATLDSTVRKIVVDNKPILLSDTVGFISKLPTALIESFKSTLAEITEADLLLHVVDLSFSGYQAQMEVVLKTLKDIGAHEKTMITVFNKIDQYSQEIEAVNEELNKPSLETLQKSWMAYHAAPAVFISAEKRIGLEKLREQISAYIPA